MEKVKEKQGGGEEFIIRPYTKKELALLYFPHSNPRTAARHLMTWLVRCQPLMAELHQLGYQSTDKTFTPRQVRCVVDHLGEPLERGLARARKEKVPKCARMSPNVPESPDRQNELS